MIALRSLVYLGVGTGQGVLALLKRFRHDPLSPGLSVVLVNDDDEQTTEQAQGNHVRPEVAVLNGFLQHELASLINALTVVLVRGIDAFQREINEAICRLLGWTLRRGIVRLLWRLPYTKGEVSSGRQHQAHNHDSTGVIQNHGSRPLRIHTLPLRRIASGSLKRRFAP